MDNILPMPNRISRRVGGFVSKPPSVLRASLSDKDRSKLKAKDLYESPFWQVLLDAANDYVLRCDKGLPNGSIGGLIDYTVSAVSKDTITNFILTLEEQARTAPDPADFNPST